MNLTIDANEYYDRHIDEIVCGNAYIACDDRNKLHNPIFNRKTMADIASHKIMSYVHNTKNDILSLNDFYNLIMGGLPDIYTIATEWYPGVFKPAKITHYYGWHVTDFQHDPEVIDNGNHEYILDLPTLHIFNKENNDEN